MLDMIKLIIVLTAVTALAGFAIGVANSKLADSIKKQEQESTQSAIGSVFPEGAAIDEIMGKAPLPDTFWMATTNGELTGYAFKMSGSGYDAAPIQFMVGVSPEGKILGITVLSHKETPGLGSRVTEVPSTKFIWYPVGGPEKSKPWFTEQFEGLSAVTPIGIEKGAEWHKLGRAARDVMKDKNAVTAITGSTITTAAFTRTIEQNVKAYLDAIGADPEHMPIGAGLDDDDDDAEEES